MKRNQRLHFVQTASNKADTDNANKHAFFIGAYANFDMLETLMRLLDDPLNDIYLFVNKNSKDFNEGFFRTVCKKSKVFFLERYPVYWGSPDLLMNGILQFFKIAAPKHYFYYHYLSGQDLPLLTNDEFHDFFIKNSGKEFLTTRSISKRNYYRYSKKQILNKYIRCRGIKKKLMSLIKYGFYFLQIGYDRVKKYFPNGTIKLGASEFSISDKLAAFVLENIPVIEQLYNGTFIPEESWLQTTLWNSPYKDNLYINEQGFPSNLRFQIWEKSGNGSPNTLTMKDLHLIQDSHCVFARKFSYKVDADIISLLSREHE